MLSLRLTFKGRATPPPTWCLFSELVTDLANEIGNCQEWDPELFHSPAQQTLPSPRRLPGNIAPGRELAVDIPLAGNSGDKIGRVDGFIDNLIHIFADTCGC